MTQTERDDPIGDLAKDAFVRWPFDFPKDVSLIHMHEYLRESSADNGAHEALDEAWMEWKNLDDGRRKFY